MNKRHIISIKRVNIVTSDGDLYGKVVVEGDLFFVLKI